MRAFHKNLKQFVKSFLETYKKTYKKPLRFLAEFNILICLAVLLFYY